MTSYDIGVTMFGGVIWQLPCFVFLLPKWEAHSVPCPFCSVAARMPLPRSGLPPPRAGSGCVWSSTLLRLQVLERRRTHQNRPRG